MVEDKHVYLDKKQMQRSKSKRCPLCGKDKEILHPFVIKINDQSWKKLNEIAVYGKGFKLMNTSYHDSKIHKTFDDLSLMLVHGTLYEVNLDMCLECLDKIGYRHKFKKKHVQRLYSTKNI